jgi:hypothetical protein
MFSKLRSRLTYANVVATLALFFALGGGAYAAATIGSAQVIDNSLKSQDLKDNAAVRSRDVVDDTVTGGGLAGYDVKNNSLTSADVANLTGADVSNDSLTGQQINESSLGRVPDAAHADSTSVSEATNADTLDNLDSTELLPLADRHQAGGRAERTPEWGGPGDRDL